MSSVRLYLTNASSSVVTRILQATLLVWVNQYLVRRIEPEEYSIFPIVLSLMFFADVFKQMVTGGIGRFIVESDAREDHAAVTRIVSSIFPIVLVAALLFSIAGGFAIWRIDDLLDIHAIYLPQAQGMLVMLVFTLCLNVITAPFADGGYVRQRFVAMNLLDLGCEALRISILLFLLFNVSTKVIWLVAASTCANSVNVLIRVWLTHRWIPAIHFRKDLFSLATARKLIRFGGWTSISGFTALVSSTAPILLLNRFGTAVDVAVFYLGRLPEVQIRALTGVAAAPAQPALTRIFATEGSVALNGLYYRGGRYHLWVTLILLAPFIVFGKEIVALYAGERYANAAAVLTWLFVAYPFLWASAMFYQVAHAIGRVGAFYVCDMIVQVAILGALVYAVAYRGLGAPGAAMAMCLAGSILHVVLIWPMGLRLVNGCWNSFLRQTVFPGLFPFLAALAGCYAFHSSVQFNSWLMVGLGGVIAMCVYLLVLFRFCVDPVDRALFSRITSKLQLLKNRVANSLGYRAVSPHFSPIEIKNDF